MNRHLSRAPSRRRRSGLQGAGVLALVVCAALLAACGGSSGATSASVVPTPVPSPQITSGTPPEGAVDAVREFWSLIGDGKLAEAKRSVVAPESPIQQWSENGIAAAHLVRVVPHSVGRGPLPDATIEFAADVWIEESPAAAGVWGDPGEHQVFAHVVRMSDGTWRMWDSGTGP